MKLSAIFFALAAPAVVGAAKLATSTTVASVNPDMTAFAQGYVSGDQNMQIADVAVLSDGVFTTIAYNCGGASKKCFSDGQALLSATTTLSTTVNNNIRGRRLGGIFKGHNENTLSACAAHYGGSCLTQCDFCVSGSYGYCVSNC